MKIWLHLGRISDSVDLGVSFNYGVNGYFMFSILFFVWYLDLCFGDREADLR